MPFFKEYIFVDNRVPTIVQISFFVICTWVAHLLFKILSGAKAILYLYELKNVGSLLFLANNKVVN